MSSLFSATQYCKYRIRAKNRHDIHSPFVFDFVEQIINKRHQASNDFSASLSNQAKIWSAKQTDIILSIISYYKVSSVFWGEDVIMGNTENDTQRLFIVDASNLTEKTFRENDILILLNCHQSVNNFFQWQKILQQDFVTLSLDLYFLSVLFFKKDFLVKQHFTLKC